MTERIVRCRFPFPAQEPPVMMPEPCSAKCPNYDKRAFAQHANIAEDDPDLLEALRSFAAWFYTPDSDREAVEEQIRFAATLYTRADHDGTCIPKTILFAQYKFQQFTSGYTHLRLSEAAAAATRGDPVASWPDGESARGTSWNAMFAEYSRRYEIEPS